MYHSIAYLDNFMWSIASAQAAASLSSGATSGLTSEDHPYSRSPSPPNPKLKWISSDRISPEPPVAKKRRRRRPPPEPERVRAAQPWSPATDDGHSLSPIPGLMANSGCVVRGEVCNEMSWNSREEEGLSTPEMGILNSRKEDIMPASERASLGSQQGECLGSEGMEGSASDEMEGLASDVMDGSTSGGMEGSATDVMERSASDRMEGSALDGIAGLDSERMEGSASERMEGLDSERMERLASEKMEELASDRMDRLDSGRMAGLASARMQQLAAEEREMTATGEVRGAAPDEREGFSSQCVQLMSTGWGGGGSAAESNEAASLEREESTEPESEKLAPRASTPSEERLASPHHVMPSSAEGELAAYAYRELAACAEGERLSAAQARSLNREHEMVVAPTETGLAYEEMQEIGAQGEDGWAPTEEAWDRGNGTLAQPKDSGKEMTAPQERGRAGALGGSMVAGEAVELVSQRREERGVESLTPQRQASVAPGGRSDEEGEMDRFASSENDALLPQVENISAPGEGWEAGSERAEPPVEMGRVDSGRNGWVASCENEMSNPAKEMCTPAEKASFPAENGAERREGEVESPEEVQRLTAAGREAETCWELEESVPRGRDGGNADETEGLTVGVSEGGTSGEVAELTAGGRERGTPGEAELVSGERERGCSGGAEGLAAVEVEKQLSTGSDILGPVGELSESAATESSGSHLGEEGELLSPRREAGGRESSRDGTGEDAVVREGESVDSTVGEDHAAGAS